MPLNTTVFIMLCFCVGGDIWCLESVFYWGLGGLDGNMIKLFPCEVDLVSFRYIQQQGELHVVLKVVITLHLLNKKHKTNQNTHLQNRPCFLFVNIATSCSSVQATVGTEHHGYQGKDNAHASTGIMGSQVDSQETQGWRGGVEVENSGHYGFLC